MQHSDELLKTCCGSPAYAAPGKLLDAHSVFIRSDLFPARFAISVPCSPANRIKPQPLFVMGQIQVHVCCCMPYINCAWRICILGCFWHRYGFPLNFKQTTSVPVLEVLYKHMFACVKVFITWEHENMIWRWNLHPSTSLTESRKALEAHGCKPWLTNSSIVPCTLGIHVLTANITVYALSFMLLLIWRCLKP